MSPATPATRATRAYLVDLILFVACMVVAGALTLGIVLAMGYIAALFFH
jgi:hypothetical protein